jgi:hypothetical protein
MEEAQNMSPNQMKTLLTRIGENTKFIISGDLDQSDKYNDVKASGLYDAMDRLRAVSEIGFFKFELTDIVRNQIISKILECYLPKKVKPELITEDAKENHYDMTIQNTLTTEKHLINEVEQGNSELLFIDADMAKDVWKPVADSKPQKNSGIKVWFNKRFK